MAQNGDSGGTADLIGNSGGAWATYTYPTANSTWTVTGNTTTSFQLNFFPGGGSGPIGEILYIDNVIIREVIPEPASMVLVLGGLGLLALQRRRHSAN